MGGVRSHECCFNEFKVLVLDVDAALMAMRLLVCVPLDKDTLYKLKLEPEFVFRELEFC